jgi:phage terminase large subunit-like protein
MVNDRLFGMIYTIDPKDDWQSDLALIKANPNCGVSVDLQILRDAQAEAIQSVRKQNVFKTKHLNIWVNASTQFIPPEKWAALATNEFTEEDLAGEECLIGLDLASEVDIASKVKIFRRDTAGQPHYFIFAKHYFNSQAVEEARGEHYQEWAAEGLLTVTEGNVTDYPTIKATWSTTRKPIASVS